MKRSLALLLTLVMSLGLLAGCGSKDTTADESQQDGESGAKQIETLKVAFVPSREPQEIITATEPLKQLLKDELAKEGYEVGEVEITVGTTYEAVGEGLEAGTIDVGLIPGGTYVLYDDGAEVILTATRDSLNKDSDNPKDWNVGHPTEASDYCRSLRQGSGAGCQGQQRRGADLGGPRQRQLEHHGHLFPRRLHLPRPVVTGSLRQGHL